MAKKPTAAPVAPVAVAVEDMTDEEIAALAVIPEAPTADTVVAPEVPAVVPAAAPVEVPVIAPMITSFGQASLMDINAAARAAHNEARATVTEAHRLALEAVNKSFGVGANAPAAPAVAPQRAK